MGRLDESVSGSVERYFVPVSYNVRGHFHAGYTIVHKFGSRDGLGGANVLISEQELSVQIGGVDGIHVDNVDVLESTERQILQQVAAKTSSSNNQHLTLVLQKVFHL